MFRGNFSIDDLAQQVVGGFLFAGPFVVTEEVWNLARAMGWYHAAVTVCLVLVVGYGTLYRADEDRDANEEGELAGIPTRFLSLVAVSYLSVALLAFAFAASDVFTAASPATTTFKAVSIGSVFSVVGAATADSVF
ncbi:Putative integral membrane protein [Halogranum gelatinilyticum]|uniref:Putative integral membrane protein n=1 Tax=Halogranum gelatinilyticum TaxID=660521 RepID=A0A1G9UC64_9EURY|nr:DUF2391 family protein [Halogranum gelatinilyticum]SDM57413.1 Putative integral membrane protein [Halogranum gelatinilyticum]